MKKLTIALIIGLLAATIVLPVSVYAVDPDDPDALEIPANFMFVNRSVIETGDTVFYCLYNLDYTVAGLPDDNANINYIFRLIDSDGTTERGQALPYPYKDQGYNWGVASWYFTAAQTTALLTWNEIYVIRVSQNPAKFATPTEWDFNLDAAAYTLLTDMDDNQLQMAERLELMAQELETLWTQTLLEEQDTGTVFSSDGEAYFRNAIIGSQAMAPSIYFVQLVSIDTSTRVWGTSLSDDYKERLYGVDGLPGTADDNWIYTSIAGAADLVSVPSVLIVGMAVLAGCVWLIYQSNKQWQTPMPGYAGSLLLVMAGGMVFLGLQVVALIAFALVLTGGWLLFMRKA
jgi:hypothetical protein